MRRPPWTPAGRYRKNDSGLVQSFLDCLDRLLAFELAGDSLFGLEGCCDADKVGGVDAAVAAAALGSLISYFPAWLDSQKLPSRQARAAVRELRRCGLSA